MELNEDKNISKAMGQSDSSVNKKIIALNKYIRKKEKSQINNPSFHFKNLEKKEGEKANRRQK